MITLMGIAGIDIACETCPCALRWKAMKILVIPTP
jgi:hypothetical protein